MSNGTPDCIDDQHLLFFGRVIHCFARHEALMQEIIAAVSGADVASIKLLTRSLSFTEKRDALFNLLRHRAAPLDQIDQIQDYLLVLKTFTPLRDDIAHSVWIEGKPSNLIWPDWLTAGPLTAIKPMHDIGRSERDFIEDDADKVTYTLDELKADVETLEKNYVRFREYAAGIGLAFSNAV
jgi:hypothetical protein